MRGSSPGILASTTPSRRPAGVALQACAIPHHREVVALGALVACVTLHLGFGAQQAGVLGWGWARDRAQFGGGEG